MNRVVLLTLLVTVSAAHDADKSKWAKWVCGASGIYQPNAQLTGELQKCRNEMCVFQCQAKTMGWVNSDGTHSLEILEDYIKTISPEKYQNSVLSQARECYDKFGSGIDTDETCHASKQFADCSWKIVPFLTCDPDQSDS